jgi:hypothetical protein
MKKILKAIMAALFLSMSATAFAQCMTINQPGPPRIWDGARGCYVPQGTPALGTAVQRGYNPYIGQPQYYNGNSLPFGVRHGSSNECAGLFERIGRVAGANHGNDARHTENGGFAGYLVGKVFCTPPYAVVPTQPQLVRTVPDEEQASYERRAYPARSGGYTRCTVRSGANGSEIRETINVATPEDCAKVGEIVADAKQQVSERAPRKEAKLATYGREATRRDGHTCAHFLNGEVVVDYFDKSRNPEGIEIPSMGAGAQCRELKEKFKQANGLT